MAEHTLLTVTDLSKHYGDVVVLDRVSFSIAQGEYVGLIGPNGAGKSTLFKVILGLEKPTEGSVAFAPNVRVGYVPQHYTLRGTVPISVQEVLGMTHGHTLWHDGHRAACEEALTFVGFGPEMLEQNFHQLSGGQKQRVIIARALMHQPDMVFFDEPLSGVDHATKVRIYELLHEINQAQGIAIVFVSHEIEAIIEKCDRILCLDQKLHTGCHPLAFARGEVTACDINLPARLGGIHHHDR